MNGYVAKIEVEDGDIKKIFERLNNAQEEIYKCYSELSALGVVTLRKKELSSEKNDSSSC